MPFEKVARFLFLPETKLVRVLRVNSASTVYLLEKTSPYEVCPKCANICAAVHDHREATIRDAPIRGKGIVYKIRKRRFKCRHCKKVFTEPVPGISKGGRTTERFKRHVLWACENFLDLKRVCRHCRCSTGYAYKALYQVLRQNQKARECAWPSTIGIDEHMFRRYKNGKIGWVTVFVDFKARRLYEMCEGKEPDSLRTDLSDKPGRDNVRFVVMDLSETFRSFTKSFFPKAQRVADKFHVLRLFSKAINRKRIDTSGDKRKHPIRSLLLRNAKDLEGHEQNALRAYLNFHPDLRELYEIKEAMHRLYRMKGPTRATRVFRRLLDRMGHSSQPAILKIRTTLLEWRGEILAYFLTGLTNAKTEGFNNKAKVMQHKAYGYRSFQNYRLRVLNACA